MVLCKPCFPPQAIQPEPRAAVGVRRRPREQVDAQSSVGSVKRAREPQANEGTLVADSTGKVAGASSGSGSAPVDYESNMAGSIRFQCRDGRRCRELGSLTFGLSSGWSVSFGMMCEVCQEVHLRPNKLACRVDYVSF